MEQMIQSYYDQMARRLLQGEIGPEMPVWHQFLLFLLEYSIPYELSSAVARLNMQSDQPGFDEKLFFYESFSEPAVLPFYDFTIPAERPRKAESSLSAFSIQAVLEDVRMKIRQLKRASFR